MKYKELKEKTPQELQTLLEQSGEELQDLRFKVVTRELKNVRAVREKRKIIARIHTLKGTQK